MSKVPVETVSVSVGVLDSAKPNQSVSFPGIVLNAAESKTADDELVGVNTKPSSE